MGCEEDAPPADQAAYHEDGEVQVLFENDPEGVNVVFLGDGFTRSGLEVAGDYQRSGTDIINYLFSVPPFSTYREYFNAYIVYAESAEALTTDKTLKRNTTFGTTWDSTVDRVLLANPSACIDYARRAVGGNPDKAHIMILLADVDLYGGSALNKIATSARRVKEEVIVHEIGHAFANLADEYVDAGVTYDPRWFLRYSANVDDHSDLDSIKWSHLIGREGYEAVGAYEGGSYVSEGIWRPEEFSMMSDVTIGHFNAPSREAIVRRILQIKGIPYELEDFLANDVIPPAFNARASRRSPRMLFGCRY